MNKMRIRNHTEFTAHPSMSMVSGLAVIAADSELRHENHNTQNRNTLELPRTNFTSYSYPPRPIEGVRDVIGVPAGGGSDLPRKNPFLVFG